MPMPAFFTVHSLKLTQPLKMCMVGDDPFLLGPIFRGYASFREGICLRPSHLHSIHWEQIAGFSPPPAAVSNDSRSPLLPPESVTSSQKNMLSFWPSKVFCFKKRKKVNETNHLVWYYMNLYDTVQTFQWLQMATLNLNRMFLGVTPDPPPLWGCHLEGSGQPNSNQVDTCQPSDQQITTSGEKSQKRATCQIVWKNILEIPILTSLTVMTVLYPDVQRSDFVRNAATKLRYESQKNLPTLCTA